MNEHIEAYLKQHHCRDYFNSYGETVEDDHYFMYQEEVDGLIELIVLECMRMCEVTEMSFVTHDCDVEASGAITVRKFIGLTEEERDEICLGDEAIARAIEAKLKEKNGY